MKTDSIQSSDSNSIRTGGEKNRKKTRAPGFIVCGQFIRYSFWQWVIRLSGSRENAERFFLRASEAKAKDIVGWIRGGIGRNGYCWNACLLETTNPGAAREWIENMFKRGPTQARALIAQALRDMADGIEGGKA
jgi:hypothetical protein